jgi:lipopolysaccharide heptosyltransferase II
LVRSTNWLGDAVMSTPALLRLREKFPDAHIALLAPEKLRELWTNHPAVNEIISFRVGEGLFSVTKKLRAGKFDLALVLPNSPRSAMEVWWAGIPQRLGCARPWRNFFLTKTIPTRPGHAQMHKRSVGEIKQLVAADVNRRTDRAFTSAAAAHQIHEYLHLVAALGANPEPLPPQLFVTAEEVETAKKKFGLEKITGPILGLNPGAEYGPAKRWPVGRFIAAAKEIQQRTNCVWLIFGSKGDVEICNRIAGAITPHASRFTPLNLAGKTSLRELMSLLKTCRVLLTNDTGPMHVAAALGTPVVVPFGSTSPELTGPGLPGDPRHRLLKSDAPCSPCFLRECPIDFRCMNGISVERVVNAVLEFKL